MAVLRDDGKSSNQPAMTSADPLKSLRKTADELGQAKNWPEYARVLTELIGLDDDQQRQAVLYSNRSTAFHKLGDYSRALDDIESAVKCSPDDPEAYHWRGVLHAETGNVPEAIANFNKTLELNPHHARAHQSRGITYVRLGDYSTAISDLEHAIELNPNDALSYLNCCFAYRSRRQYDKAIAVATKAIRRHPTNALAYAHRGMAYMYKGHYGRALNDIVSAHNHDSTLRLQFAGPYFALRLHRIYPAGDNRRRNRAFKYLNRLFNAIAAIQDKLFCGPAGVPEVAHYTSLHTLKHLATDSAFRLYNAAYMNDPEEGRVLFEIMEGDYNTDLQANFYRGRTHPSPAYIGSFIKVRQRGSEPKDKLFLWRTYGRHDGEDAAGACLIFKHNGQSFSPAAPSRMGDMREPPARPALYRVAYRTDEGQISEDLTAELLELSESLKQVKANVLHKANDTKEQLRDLVCELLDSIRFLFKKDHYREEQEVRIVEIRNEEQTEDGKADGVSIDTDRIPPRLYLEAGDSVRFGEVILGPEARAVYEWTRWLKEQDKTLIVAKSRIEYGEQHP